MNVVSLPAVASLPDPEFCLRLTLALVHFVWQGCVVGAISAAIAWSLRGRSARLRYLLDVAALVIVAACLPATYWLVETPAIERPALVSNPAAINTPPSAHDDSDDPDVANTFADRPATTVAAAQAPGDIGVLPPVPEPGTVSGPLPGSKASVLTRRLEWVAPYATALYFVGVVLMTLRLLAALWGGHRLRASAVPVTDTALLEIVRQQSQHVGLQVMPLVAWCGRVSTPIVVGIVRPAILLPGALATGLSPEQFSVLLTHELAHIRRYDLVVNLLQRSIEAALFFHPAVWSISRRISREREHCCDDAVVMAGCPRIAYAEALVRMAELCFPQQSLAGAAALGAAGAGRSEFKQRVLRLLSVSDPPPVRLSRWGVIVLGMVLGLAVVIPPLLLRDVLAQSDRPTDASPGAATPEREPDPPPENSTIRVTLKLDRTEFLLGESIAVSYEMTNAGEQPAHYGRGAIYPALRINDGYRMTALEVDENGVPTGKSAVLWPLPEYQGGPINLNGWTLEPGEQRVDTLFVTRYIRFDAPGKYRLRVENVDRHTGGTYSSGETIVTLRQPTPEQARQVYEAMKRAPREAYRDSDMTFIPGAADFETMHQPVYLDVLKGFAASNDMDALPSLERMGRREANAVLVAQAARAMDETNWEFARACFGHLKQSLPFPNWYDEGNVDWDKTRREHVDRTWSTEFGPVLTRLARGLTAQLLATGRDPKSVPAADQERWQSQLSEIDYIYRCVGQPEDFADCLRAYAISIALTRTLPFETHQYYRPRGSAFGFGHSVFRMLQRGAKPPVSPSHPGEAAAYLIGLRTQPQFRPTDWPDVVVKWFRFGIDEDLPYLSEFVLDHLPDPIPQSIIDAIPAALAHPYIDLQIAACKIAERYPRPAFREPLRQLLQTAKEEHLVEFATSAGLAHGIQLVPPTGALSETTLPDHLNVMAVAYAEDDSALISVATEHDVAIRFWGTADAQPRTVKLDTDQHGNFFLNDTLRLSAGGSTIAASLDGEVGVWEARTGKRTGTLAPPGNARIEAVALSANGSVAAGAGSLGTGFPLPDSPLPVYVWNVKTRKLIGEFSHAGGLQIHDLALSADGRFLASASQEAGAMVWDLTTGERLYAIANDNTGREHPAGPFNQSVANQVLSLAFSRDGSVLATGDLFGVKLYGVATGQLMRVIHAPFRYGRSALLFSPDGQRVARVAADKMVLVWDAGTGTRLFELQTDSNSAAFSRDGRQLAVGFSDSEKALKVFELTRE